MNSFAPKNIKSKNDVGLDKVDNLSFEDIKTLLIQQLYPVRFKIQSEADEDILTYDAARPENERWTNKQPYSYIRNREHRFTKIQCWGGGDSCIVKASQSTESTADLVYGNIFIPRTGNQFNLYLSADNLNKRYPLINDIVYENGETIPVGTILSFFVTCYDTADMFTVDTPHKRYQLLGRINLSYRLFNQLQSNPSTNWRDDLTGANFNQLGIQLIHGDYFMIQKTDQFSWNIISFPQHFIRSIASLNKAAVNSNWDTVSSTEPSFIRNKPTNLARIVGHAIFNIGDISDPGGLKYPTYSGDVGSLIKAEAADPFYRVIFEWNTTTALKLINYVDWIPHIWIRNTDTSGNNWGNTMVVTATGEKTTNSLEVLLKDTASSINNIELHIIAMVYDN